MTEVTTPKELVRLHIALPGAQPFTLTMSFEAETRVGDLIRGNPEGVKTLVQTACAGVYHLFLANCARAIFQVDTDVEIVLPNAPPNGRPS